MVNKYSFFGLHGKPCHGASSPPRSLGFLGQDIANFTLGCELRSSRGNSFLQYMVSPLTFLGPRRTERGIPSKAPTCQRTSASKPFPGSSMKASWLSCWSLLSLASPHGSGSCLQADALAFSCASSSRSCKCCFKSNAVATGRAGYAADVCNSARSS